MSTSPHSTLCGSEKYPDPNLFFSMMSQTYTTFLNAATHQNFTTYPMASLSEDQLSKVMDMVLAGLAHPTIMTDERAMMREAYRYELTDADADITLVGTVYSKLLGVLNTFNMASYNLAKRLYPGSTHSVVTGGVPEIIPAMTHQELKDYHDKADMSQEEIDALVAHTADFAAWTEENTKHSMIDQEKLLEYSLYTCLLTNMPTTERDSAELSLEIACTLADPKFTSRNSGAEGRCEAPRLQR